MKSALSTTGHPVALAWLDEYSKRIVKKVLAEEFNVEAIDVRQWTPKGLKDFIDEFEAAMKHHPSQPSFWDYEYLAYLQDRLKLRAKQAGIYYDFGERPSPDDFLMPRSIWQLLHKNRKAAEELQQWRRQLEDNKSRTSPIQVGPGGQPGEAKPKPEKPREDNRPDMRPEPPELGWVK